ncbi:MAG: SpoIIE family protein phosphatase [Clostridiales bacterium]|nr:SpoIIE family protein phosphatase [Clostridiales bacterium]
MLTQSVIDALYRELLLVPIILFIILLVNSVVLYKQKLSSDISIILISCLVMCSFELCWEYCDGNPGLRVYTYIGACGYVLAFVIFGAVFNRYFFREFEKMPDNRHVRNLIYIVPLVCMFILCVTTPWTKLLLWVNEDGIVQEGVLFSTLFYGILLAYLLSSLGLALYHVIRMRHKDTAKDNKAIGLIVFGILGPLVYILQIIIIGNPESDYYSLSLANSIAMVFLTTYISTHSLIEDQSRIEAVDTELRIASWIQTGALPPISPEFADHPNVNIRACMNTAKEVGGDFYDYFVIDDTHIGFLIADVSGKGTPAALFMMTAKTMIKDYALTCPDTGSIFTAVNQRLSENNAASMFATAWIGILDTSTMTLQYTNAGHNYPLFLREGECKMLKKVHGMFLAGMDDTVYEQDEILLEPGDRLLLYTDGVTEAHDQQGKLYSTKRLIRMMEDSVNYTGEETIGNIIKDVAQFADGTLQFDDITMLMLTIKR